MKKLAEEVAVPYSARRMFDLVADIESYPAFLPWIQSLRIVSTEQVSQHCQRVIADMRIRYRFFSDVFRTNVAFDADAKVIKVRYISGPFSHLTNDWQFRDVGPDSVASRREKAPDRAESAANLPSAPASVVRFEIGFAFRNRLMQAIAGKLLDRVFLRLSASFIQRAHQLYGGDAQLGADECKASR